MESNYNRRKLFDDEEDNEDQQQDFNCKSIQHYTHFYLPLNRLSRKPAGAESESEFKQLIAEQLGPAAESKQ